MMERVEPVGRGTVWKMGEDERKMGGKGQLSGLLFQGKGGAASGAKITGQRGGFLAAPAGQKKQAPFGLGENQETRGTAAVCVSLVCFATVRGKGQCV
jgi:hypothetical protein